MTTRFPAATPVAPAAIWPAETAPATGPLRGVRVLDLTTVIMGPFATQILGDQGADVIKIETAAGDNVRWVGPWRHAGMGPLFLQVNRNKRSVVLDLKSSAGKQAMLALAAKADVVVSNVRPAGLARLGLDYDSLRAINPRIIYCGAVGYGSDGPNAGKAVYDDLMQAASGICSLFQHVNGKPGFMPMNGCDRIVGLYVANAVSSALYHRAMTGEGQAIEVPMFETMVQFALGDHMMGAVFAPPLGEMGYKRVLSSTRVPHATQDGYLAIVVYTDKQWRDLTRLLGCPDLLDTDERFKSTDSRTRFADEVGRFFSRHLATRTTSAWLQALHAIDIPAAPVAEISSLFDDPHLQAVAFFETWEHPTEGTVNVCRFPVQYSASPASIRRLAPNLGEHTVEVLGPALPSEDGLAKDDTR
jgi:crotonobetainyl-CoA:carnitine CoA-transferase CaiB-like acyl-CoA transferase